MQYLFSAAVIKMLKLDYPPPEAVALIPIFSTYRIFFYRTGFSGKASQEHDHDRSMWVIKLD